ncbi:hypothetical protein EMIT043CA1_330009 [Pseudomonas brassicacearum]
MLYLPRPRLRKSPASKSTAYHSSWFRTYRPFPQVFQALRIHRLAHGSYRRDLDGLLILRHRDAME